MTKNGQIHRHSLVVRLCHWLIALSGLLLTFSGIGFMPLYGRFYLNELPGLHWVTHFQTQMNLHYLAAGPFIAACLFHLLYHWRRGEFALVPQRGDLKESWLIIKAMLMKGQEPAHEKFLAEQRIAYATFALTIGVLSASGYFLAVKNTLGWHVAPQVLQVIILMHLVFTFLFLLQIALHLGAFILKANRPLFASMFNGRVTLSYAAKRHSRWVKRNRIR
ncbi:MAG: hypothetical protein C0618_02625 [Desulfuromonas sp.]|nr:MAG: hypothetical protein C0618_02625 [Desulfuromonas sp.]